MYYNQELGLCIEFGSRVDSVRRGGGGPWIKSPLRRFTPSWTFTRVACDCLLPFVHPLLSQVKVSRHKVHRVHIMQRHQDVQIKKLGKQRRMHGAVELLLGCEKFWMGLS